MKKEKNKIEPEKILRTIKRDEFRKNRGKLKIFFGMAAGVGKTYSMLEYAHQLKKEGIDIVIGYIETHGRIDTIKLVSGLEIVKRKKIEYKNVLLEEMDIDAIILRNPQAVLIDELAHTNVEGSRHSKRYLDVIEILDYGINVYTTLNIQHLESYSTSVEEITGVAIRETIPDGLLEYADSIELVDLSPEDLLKRLEEGKVYTKEKSKTALENFFKKENLTALREMSLRYTAKKVDRQLQEFLEDKNKIWKTGDRFLVAISPSPNSEYLIKWAKRTSFNQKADWIAVYVERKIKLSEKEEASLKANLDLARELGAEVIATYDDDIVNGILRIAYQKNISLIIVGKTNEKNILEKITSSNILDRLIKKSGDIDIVVATEPGLKKKRSYKFHLKVESSIKEYLLASAVIFFVTILNLLLFKIAGYWTLGLIYLSAIPICAIFLGKGPVILAATLSALLWNFLFIPPRFTFYISKLEDLLMFIMYFIIAIVTGNLTSKLHLKEMALRIREKRISDLYEISNAIGSSTEINEIINSSTILIEKFLNAKTVFYLTDDNGNLLKKPHDESNFLINEKEYSVLLWSFDNKKSSGKFTDTLPMSEGYYIPLLGISGIYGVIGFNFSDLKALKLEQENFIKAIVRLIAIAIERFFLISKMQKIKISAESERLYKIILNSISHELRTPITTISFSASGLMDDIIFKNEEFRKILCSDIVQATERLNRTVGNLLDMARIESGNLKLNIQWYNIEDLVSVVYHKIEKNFVDHELIKEISENLPMIQIDLVLMEQVLTNLLLNAVIHTPQKSKIFFKIFEKNDNIIFIIEDNGKGFSDEDIMHIFEKFYRSKTSKTGGIGLGLSISKSIVEIHGGTITAENNEIGGASFIIKLPLKK